MKIAIVHDELVRRGGAEQFTLIMHKAFPDAPIYTSIYNPENTYDPFRNANIHTSWLNKFVKEENMLKKLFFPFGYLAMKSIHLDEYDIVFMSTTTGAKYVQIKPETLVICFCHYPFRLLWFPNSYSQYTKSKGIKRKLFNLLISIFKPIDLKASRRINKFITNTPEIAEIIKECYAPIDDIAVLYSSISCDNFHLEKNPSEDYYLAIGRIEPYKRVDILVDAFNQLPDKRIIIVGKGSQKESLKIKANDNIIFKEALSKEEIANLYANCKAFLFPQIEDYGLTPIEANASGRPVIAYKEGGVNYTMIPYDGNNENECTAYFFEEQTSDCLIDAIRKSEHLKFKNSFIRNHAKKFDEKVFIEKIQTLVEEKYKQHKL